MRLAKADALRRKKVRDVDRETSVADEKMRSFAPHPKNVHKPWAWPLNLGDFHPGW
jgi:hypothetical protein